MQLQTVSLSHFRNYTNKMFSFHKGMNVVLGNNGVGKSSLIESIYLFTTGCSFRTSQLTDLCQEGKNLFSVTSTFLRDGVSQSLCFRLGNGKREVQHNRFHAKKQTELLGLFPSVLYAPKDHALITGTPSERRRFLNIQLSQVDPLYSHHLIRYKKGLKQRNTLLRQKQREAISSWEHVLSLSGAYLMEKRNALIDHLQSTISSHEGLKHVRSQGFSLSYLPSISFPIGNRVTREELFSLLKKELQRERERDLAAGSTSIGPHRDDFLLFHRGKEAKTYASEGQKRSYIAALKTAEWMYLKDKLHCSPLFMIDDFDIHLDALRRRDLEKQLSFFQQVIATTPNASSIFKDGHTILLKEEETSLSSFS